MNESKWATGTVIRAAFTEGDPELRERVRDTALGWTGQHLADLEIEFVAAGSADVRIAFMSGKGSWSVLGRSAGKSLKTSRR